MDVDTLRAKYTALAPVLNERTRRLWAAAEAEAIGHGGIARVARATGMSRTRIARGIQELRSDEPLDADRTGRPGGGRKRRVDTDPTLVSDLNALLEPVTAGAPDDSPLRWTSKSIRTLTGELQALGHSLSRGILHGLLHRLGYTLQANRKTKEGTQHPDRDAQFTYLNEQVRSAQEKGHPVISVDTKKKELIGDFKNGGRTWRPKRDPEPVRVHDFVIPTQGKAIPYGIYDLSRNEGWVSVGITHDTAHFAVNAIRSWWKHMGRPAYGGTSHLLITADAGGSNGPRLRLWKWELQRFADRTGLTITVCHYPPGTSKWNRIEHRLFSYIAMNWRGQPLISLAAVVNLIGTTTTTTGLRVRSEIDERSYPKGVVVSEEQMERVKLSPHTFHGDWNYTIEPNNARTR